MRTGCSLHLAKYLQLREAVPELQPCAEAVRKLRPVERFKVAAVAYRSYPLPEKVEEQSEPPSTAVAIPIQTNDTITGADGDEQADDTASAHAPAAPVTVEVVTADATDGRGAFMKPDDGMDVDATAHAPADAVVDGTAVDLSAAATATPAEAPVGDDDTAAAAPTPYKRAADTEQRETADMVIDQVDQQAAAEQANDKVIAKLPAGATAELDAATTGSNEGTSTEPAAMDVEAAAPAEGSTVPADTMHDTVPAAQAEGSTGEAADGAGAAAEAAAEAGASMTPTADADKATAVAHTDDSGAVNVKAQSNTATAAAPPASAPIQPQQPAAAAPPPPPPVRPAFRPPCMWMLLTPVRTSTTAGQPVSEIAVPIHIDAALPDYICQATSYDAHSQRKWQVGDRFRMFFGGKLGTKVGGSYYKGKIEAVNSQLKPGDSEPDPWESVTVSWDNEDGGTQHKVSAYRDGAF